MYQNFNIIKVETDSIQRQVIIHFNLDIDPDTVTKRTLKLIDNETDAILPYKLKVRRDTVTLSLLDDPVPNREHLLLCDKSIKSITNQSLYSSKINYIVFASDIVDSVSIVSPAEQAVITACKISWKENPPLYDENTIHRYHIQIAKENLFYNVLQDSIVENQTEIEFPAFEQDGQYYVRIRIESETEYGPWSDIISFVYQSNPFGNTPEEGESESDEDKPATGTDLTPIFYSKLNTILQPENGETPISFVFQFDADIDEAALTSDMISIVRKDF